MAAFTFCVGNIVAVVDTVLEEVVVVDTAGREVDVEERGVEDELIAGIYTATSTCVPQPLPDSA